MSGVVSDSLLANTYCFVRHLLPIILHLVHVKANTCAFKLQYSCIYFDDETLEHEVSV